MTLTSQTTIELDALSDLTCRALAKLGLNETHRQVVHDVLMYAQRRCKTQGLIKIVEGTVVPAKDAQPALVEQRLGCMTHVQARGEVGMVIVNQAAELAGKHAEQFGVGLVTTSHTCTSTGSIGYYARELALKNLIGIVMAGSPKSMAVYGGVDPVMGTNPIAFAVPCFIDGANEPLVLDMASAAFTWFGLIEAKARGESIPAGVAFDNEGQPTTDPSAALAGALRAFAGPKGSGLGLMIECLTGPLAGAGIVGDDGDNRGNLVIAINPAGLGDVDGFNARVSDLVGRIKSGRIASDVGVIELPGQRGAALAQAVEQAGRLTVDTAIIEGLTTIANR